MSHNTVVCPSADPVDDSGPCKKSVTAYRHPMSSCWLLHVCYCLKASRLVIFKWLWTELRMFRGAEIDMIGSELHVWWVLVSGRLSWANTITQHQVQLPQSAYSKIVKAFNNQNGCFPISRNRAYFVTRWRWLRCELATWLDHTVPIRRVLQGTAHRCCQGPCNILRGSDLVVFGPWWLQICCASVRNSSDSRGRDTGWWYPPTPE
jgi:hypothetical protein